MKNQNGVLLFGMGEEMPLIEEVLGPEQLESKFGYIVVEKDRKFYWEPATEENFLNSESIRLGIDKDKIMKGDCSDSQTGCRGGGDPVPGACVRAFNVAQNYRYCFCS